MYIFEGLGGKNPGFQDIPNSIYWSIVTLTTVGYGTVVPVTVIGENHSFNYYVTWLWNYSSTYWYCYCRIIKTKKILVLKFVLIVLKKDMMKMPLYCKYCGSKIHND